MSGVEEGGSSWDRSQAAPPGAGSHAAATFPDDEEHTPVELPHRLVPPTRVSDVTEPVTIELPGIAHELAAGHRLALVLAGGDAAYRGSTAPQPVLLVTGGKEQQLLVPVVR